MCRFLWKLLKLAFLAWMLFVICIPIGLAIWGIEKQPLVLVGQTMNYEHVTRLHRIIKSHDPRRMHAGEIKRLVTVEDDINLVLQYGLSNLKQTGAKVDIDKAKATLRFSLGLQQFKLDGYLNLTATLAQNGQDFWLQNVRIGEIAVPNIISRVLSKVGHRLLLNLEQYKDSINAINELSFEPRQVVLVYEWRPELVKEIVVAHRDIFSSEQDAERLAVYQQRIAEISMKLSIITPAASMLAPLFETAHQRSENAEQAAAENSALLTALGVYMAGSSMQKLLGVPERPFSKRAIRRYLTLAGRYDLAQHFILSAYLANTAGGGVADGLGLFKEFKDSQGGSGFSFADLAADRAGQRFSALATSPDTAQRIQQIMKPGMQESLFMPNIDHLPEGIQEIEFKARYGSLEDKDYRVLENEIERRLKMCGAYSG